jgi:hypothetical protein
MCVRNRQNCPSGGQSDHGTKEKIHTRPAPKSKEAANKTKPSGPLYHFQNDPLIRFESWDAREAYFFHFADLFSPRALMPGQSLGLLDEHGDMGYTCPDCKRALILSLAEVAGV